MTATCKCPPRFLWVGRYEPRRVCCSVSYWTKPTWAEVLAPQPQGNAR